MSTRYCGANGNSSRHFTAAYLVDLLNKNGRKEMFYLRLYGVRHMVKDHSDRETRCRHIGYSFRLAAKVLLYASSERQDNTYHGLCYTSREALVGTRNSSMGPSWRIDPTTHRAMCERSYHGATSRSLKEKRCTLLNISFNFLSARCITIRLSHFRISVSVNLRISGSIFSALNIIAGQKRVVFNVV